MTHGRCPSVARRFSPSGGPARLFLLVSGVAAPLCQKSLKELRPSRFQQLGLRAHREGLATGASKRQLVCLEVPEDRLETGEETAAHLRGLPEDLSVDTRRAAMWAAKCSRLVKCALQARAVG